MRDAAYAFATSHRHRRLPRQRRYCRDYAFAIDTFSCFRTPPLDFAIAFVIDAFRFRFDIFAII